MGQIKRNKPFISVITPVRNGAETIQRTIDSIKKQSYKSFEYIIIDGLSNDKTEQIIMQNEIEVADDEAGFVITRSTLNRNGVFLTSGLYDTGYKGVMAGVMHVNCGKMRIKPGTRVGQYLNWKAESISSYDGDYGVGKDHDKKYA